MFFFFFLPSYISGFYKKKKKLKGRCPQYFVAGGSEEKNKGNSWKRNGPNESDGLTAQEKQIKQGSNVGSKREWEGSFSDLSSLLGPKAQSKDSVQSVNWKGVAEMF